MKLTDFTYLNETYQTPTDKVVLVGMTSNGPIQRPFLLEENKNVIDMLGKNELSTAYMQLELNNVSRENIIIYRLNGTYGEIILKNEKNEEYFKIRTVSANNNNKLIEVNILPTGIVVTKYIEIDEELNNEMIKSTEVEYKMTYIFSDYIHLYELADDINKDASLGLIDIIAKELIDGNIENYFKEERKIMLDTSDSENGYCLSNEDSYENFKPLYWDKFHKGVIGQDYNGNYINTRLSNIKSELMIFTDVYYDKFPEIGTFVAKLANQIQDEQDIYIASVIGVSKTPDLDTPPEDYTLISGNQYYNDIGETVYFDKRKTIKSYISDLKTLATTEERNEEYMNNLQVVIGTEYEEIEEKYYNALGSYAGVYIKNNKFIPVSNKEIFYINEILDSITRTETSELSKYGYISLVPSIRKNLVAFKAQSFESNNTILSQLNNKRLYGVIKTDLRTILDVYIGKNRKKINVAQLSKYFDEYFDNLIKYNYINDYTYELPSQQKWDNQDIYDLKIELILYGEIHNINSNFSINPKDEGGITVWETIED